MPGDKWGNLASVHFSVAETGGRWLLKLKLKSNLKSEHGMVEPPIYTKGDLHTDHVCTYLTSISDYKLLKKKDINRPC